MIELYEDMRAVPLPNYISAFRFNGILSSDLGIIITKPPEDELPTRDIEVVSVPGRNGDLLFDRGRYTNVKRKYNCAVLPERQNRILDSPFSLDIIQMSRERSNVECKYTLATSNIYNELYPSSKYCRLEDTYNPHIFRMARVTSSIKMNNIVNQVGEFSIEFECKPQKFLITGEIPVVFYGDLNGSTRKLYNGYNQTAKPLIRVSGSGSGEITVGDVTVEFFDLTETIYLDCETMNAYSINESGVYINQNRNIKAMEFPELPPNSSVISWSGGVERIEITPRWWMI